MLVICWRLESSLSRAVRRSGERHVKFDMSEAWREAMAMITANREVLLVVAGIFFLLPSLALGLSMGGIEESMLTDPETAQAQLYELYAGWWWLFIAVLLAEIVGYLA